MHFSNRHYIAGVVTERTPGLTGLGRVRAVDVIEVVNGDPMDESGRLREILTTHRVSSDQRFRETRVSCDVVLNCLGAWSPIFEFIWPRLTHRSSSFERCGHLCGWSGLYAVTPDCSGIARPLASRSTSYLDLSMTWIQLPGLGIVGGHSPPPVTSSAAPET